MVVTDALAQNGCQLISNHHADTSMAIMSQEPYYTMYTLCCSHSANRSGVIATLLVPLLLLGSCSQGVNALCARATIPI